MQDGSGKARMARMEQGCKRLAGQRPCKAQGVAVAVLCCGLDWMHVVVNLGCPGAGHQASRQGSLVDLCGRQ